jgi:hypothetical protein
MDATNRVLLALFPFHLEDNPLGLNPWEFVAVTMEDGKRWVLPVERYRQLVRSVGKARWGLSEVN